uniref:DUF2877 domain-containing protein n=1 Tax=Citrobacter freundii TaxID=546 RepID=A0A7T8TIV3_CITFR|nr:DUF2877 domain-containing protein [Citrobacter freundii]
MAKQVNRPLREVNIAIEDNEQQISQLVDGLIGFGFGLTPDGDDYLLGYLAAISFFATGHYFEASTGAYQNYYIEAGSYQ